MSTPNSEGHNDSHDSIDEVYSGGDGQGIFAQISSCWGKQTTKTASDVITVDERDQPSEDKSENYGDIWSRLPSLCLQNIYSFLNRSDQSRMSQTCKRWASEQGSPCLWRTVKFYLPEHVYASEVYPEVKFARKYGDMFRNVQIIGRRVKGSLLGTVCDQLKWFLESLTARSQLVSIKIISIPHYLHKVQDSEREDVVTSMSQFFRSQCNLNTVEFRDTNFSKREGADVLDALLVKYKSSVKKLVLTKFVYNSIFIDLHNFLNSHPKIGNKIFDLETLEIDYSQFFENTIHWWYVRDVSWGPGNVNSKLTLKNLKVTCTGGRRGLFRGIPSAVWKHLASRCSDLKLEFVLASVPQLLLEVNFYLVKEMPLRCLEIRLDHGNAPATTEIRTLFDHIVNSRINATLETLYVDWGLIQNEFSRPFISLLRTCPKLKFVQISSRFPMEGIRAIFESLLEQRPKDLVSLSLIVVSVNPEGECANLLALGAEYYTLLKEIDIDTKLIPELGESFRRV